MENRHGKWLKNVPLAAFKSQAELAEDLGTQQQVIAAIKAKDRGLSPANARKVAELGGGKAGNLYLESQVESLKMKTALKRVSPNGTLHSCETIMKAIKGDFRPDELNVKDPAFRAAAEQLKKIATAALDLADDTDESMGPKAGSPNVEPLHATGDSVAPALKSQRDPFGRAMPEGEKVERDGYGKRIR